VRAWATIAAAVAILAGCGDGATEQASAPVSSQGALVAYTRSGGIAATTQHMVVQPDGSAIVRVEGPGNVDADFKLSDPQLAELKSALGAATLDGEAEPTGCADCYTYTITADGSTASFDETQIPPGTQHLVSLLEAIVERETPTGPARNG